MIIVTGIGRSGTSFTAKLLLEAGANFRGLSSYEKINAGMEHPHVVMINHEIVHSKARSVKAAISNLGLKKLDEELGKGVIVKDPLFLMTIKEWTESDFDIEHIIYCRRDFKEIYRSSMESGGGVGGYGPDGITVLSFKGFNICFSYMEKMFFYMAGQASIPVTEITFPDSVKNFSEAEKLSRFVEPAKLREAWDKVRRPDLVGVKTSSQDGRPGSVNRKQDRSKRSAADSINRELIGDDNPFAAILAENEALRALTGSRSWRFTAPFRRASAVLKRIF